MSWFISAMLLVPTTVREGGLIEDDDEGFLFFIFFIIFIYGEEGGCGGVEFWTWLS